MDKRIVILGAGESGTGAAILAKRQGYDVFVSDNGIIKSKYKEMLYDYEIQWEEEKHTDRLILDADEVIKSPGIPERSPIIQAIRKKGIRIISEIEFASRFTDAKKICITGSNGKTTTTSLIHHMMRKAGMNVGIAGNIGRSFALQVAEGDYDYYVLELSSFQMDGLYEFKADIAILLNITPMSVSDLILKGKHNQYNSMAAGIAGNVLKIRKDLIRESLMDFQGVEHRLEGVLKVHGIQFINDSKATNVNSTWYALESVQTRIIWIAGGIDKGNEYDQLMDLVKEKVKALICLGKDNRKLHEAFDGVIETIEDMNDMKEAVRTAYFLAANGETVLLSPACASFDLFENYEDRGWQFKEAVREL